MTVQTAERGVGVGPAPAGTRRASGAALECVALTKVYRMGEVEVHALRGVDLRLLCDEPTGALDCQTGWMVLDAIAKVNREIGTTTAVITHNAPIAAIGDR